MYQPLRAIVLRSVRHNDKRLVVTVYSRELGRLAFLVPDAATAAGARRRAMLSPLSLVECVADVRAGSDLHRMRDLRLATPLPDLHFNPAKSAIAMLIADILATALREPQPDPLLYDYIESVVIRLELAQKGIANYHICFLIGLQQFLGIAPDLSEYRPGLHLDLGEGMLTTIIDAWDSPHLLTADETAAAATLGRMNWRNLWLYRLNREQRNAILDKLIEYYTLHEIPLSQLKTLDTLRQLFV